MRGRLGFPMRAGDDVPITSLLKKPARSSSDIFANLSAAPAAKDDSDSEEEWGG